MSRIDDIFADLRAANKAALMPFVTAGRPSLEALPAMLLALQEGGASIVEIGFPFSDPIADGPVIAASMHEALQHDVHPEGIFEQVASVRDRLTIGLVAMVSVSIVYRMGLEQFCGMAAKAGFDGLIIPDVPVDEFAPLHHAINESGLTASLLIAPTTPDDRAEKIASHCSGFVYILARTGITGEQTDAPDVQARVESLRKVTDLPLACGFGIANAEHVRSVSEHADAVIVGSALVRRIEEAHAGGEDAIATARGFVSELATGLRGS
ncbi:MAG: tryptophan synthase subunit alpha [Planctomycetota bacterium]|jgi:tryptophan synthase alpha chain